MPNLDQQRAKENPYEDLHCSGYAGGDRPFPPGCDGIEPTTIEPAGSVIPHTIEVEEAVTYLDMDEHERVSETELTISLNKHLAIGVSVPFLFEQDDKGELEDVALFIVY